MLDTNNLRKKIKKVWFYDIEQFSNFHSCVFISWNGKERRVFIIHTSKNQIFEYLEFLRTEVKSLIGFNNLNYDYPMIYFIMNILPRHSKALNNSNYINQLLKEENDRLLDKENKFTSIPSWNVQIPQLDIFRIQHFDNRNNSASLKQIQFVTRQENVQDLELGFHIKVEDQHIPEIIKYNINDVESTRDFVLSCQAEIDLRKNIKSLYSHYENVDWMNCNDAKIGSEIFTVPISNSLNIDIRTLRTLRTYRRYIRIKDIIFDYINFKTEIFQDVLKKFNSHTINSNDKDFKITTSYKRVKFEYAKGGLHACIKSGKYFSNEIYDIIDIDVASFYPRLSIVNKFYPEHLGEEFCNIYESIYNQRMEAKKLAKNGIDKYRNKLLVAVYKLALNGVYGKSNDKWSYFMDSQYTMQTTINGQLLLTMLTERICLYLPETIILQCNTDGITLKVRKIDREKMLQICKKWERITNLELEYCDYKAMIIRDVNNYLAIKKEDENNLEPSQPESNFYNNFYTKHKTKGCFEVVKEKNGKISYAKNWSQIIVQKALYQYYVYGVSINQFILNHNDILDFCKMYKANKSPKTGGVLEGHFINNNAEDKKLTKITRYYISSNGGKLIKRDNITGKESNIEKGFRCTIFNKYIKKDIKKYNIDYSYYINECNKIINSIENNFQLVMDL